MLISTTSLVLYVVVAVVGYLVRHLTLPPAGGTTPAPTVKPAPVPVPAQPTPLSPLLQQVLAAVESQVQAEMQQVLDSVASRVLPSPTPATPAKP